MMQGRRNEFFLGEAKKISFYKTLNLVEAFSFKASPVPLPLGMNCFCPMYAIQNLIELFDRSGTLGFGFWNCLRKMGKNKAFHRFLPNFCLMFDAFSKWSAPKALQKFENHQNKSLVQIALKAKRIFWLILGIRSVTSCSSIFYNLHSAFLAVQISTRMHVSQRQFSISFF